MSALVMLTAATSAGLIFSRLNDQLIDAKMDELERETELEAAIFVNRIDELRRDVLLLAGTPPILGIARAITSGGIDPEDGSTVEAWRRRLEVIFRETLNSKPAYLQVRYIGVDNNGTELVRVHRNRPGEAIQIIASGDLQAKGDRPYVQETLRRAPGQVYLSAINLNREFGEIQRPRLPVVRAGVPVYFAGHVYGMVVVNFAIQPTFEEMATVGGRTHNLFLTNDRGDYLRHPDPDRAFAFEFGQTMNVVDDFQSISLILDRPAGALSRLSEDGDLVISGRVVPFGPPDLGRRLGLFVTDGIEYATAVAAEVARQVALLFVLLVGIAILVGVWLSRLAVGPIVRLSDAVENLDRDNPSLVLPDGVSGEAKHLGEALVDALEQLRQRNLELEASNRELKQFSYIASHDLQEPVRTVTSFATLLDENYRDQMDERGRKSLGFILESCTRMQALIHGLLEFSRLGIEATPERVSLEKLVRDVAADLAGVIEESGAMIDCGPLPTLTVYGVEMRLLFQNLIANAIKFRRVDTPPRVEIGATQDRDGWLITIADNGIGIPPNQREKVFLIFQRLHNRATYEGTGIGLAHCRKIVDMHHGRIWVEDSDTGGSKFCVFLKEVRG